MISFGCCITVRKTQHIMLGDRSTLQLVLLVHHQDSIVLWNLSNFLEHSDVPGPSCTVPAQLKNGSSHFFQDYCFLRVICQLCSRQLDLSKSGGETIIRVENKLLTSWQQGWKATTESPELPDLVKPRSFQNLRESSRPVTYLLNIFITPRGNSTPIKQSLPRPSLPQPWQRGVYFGSPGFFYSERIIRMNHTLCDLLCLASFTYRSVLPVFSRSIPFVACVNTSFSRLNNIPVIDWVPTLCQEQLLNVQEGWQYLLATSDDQWYLVALHPGTLGFRAKLLTSYRRSSWKTMSPSYRANPEELKVFDLG
ncbi:uncharacterized protein LOC116596413 [Mustela erminea]|uniref:uncharacterized protein LOC116596413 n=1 Tax=Mustela erminea TaxID=36723 RepID=UPI00138732D8|nr:uncharacterized protein LOC116596413 [Mustela erminea]